jgi:DNA polymerase-3 subunit delta
LSLDVIRRDLAAAALPAVYLWHGEDRHTILEAVALLRARFLADDPSGSNVELFGGKSYLAEDVVAAARTAAFFSGRLIVADDFTYFKPEKDAAGKGKSESKSKSKSKSKNAAADDAFLDYCQAPNPDNCLLFIAADVNRGRRLYKEILKNGKIVEFALPQGEAWTAWCVREAAARGKNMSAAAAKFFLDWSGHGTGLLAGELDKLALYSEGAEIRAEDIRAVCVPRPETTVFAMLDDWAAGRTGPALRKLDEVLGQDYYLQVFTMIVRHIRLLLAAALVRARRGDVKDFMAAAGVRTPYEAGKIFRQSSRFTATRLAGMMENCLRTETALKSSGGDPQTLLEILLLK